MYCRRKDVAVVCVGKIQGLDYVLVTADYGIRKRYIHQLTGAFKLLSRNVLPVIEYISNPLVVDGFGPAHANDPSQSNVHQGAA